MSRIDDLMIPCPRCGAEYPERLAVDPNGDVVGCDACIHLIEYQDFLDNMVWKGGDDGE